MTSKKPYAIVLSGGGARGAYQAGVLRALFEISQKVGHFEVFRNLTGVSAGAINACFIASYADDLDLATSKLCELWRKLEADDVFETDYTSLTRNAVKLIRGVSLGGLSDKLRPISVGLLDTKPLQDLLAKKIPLDRIRQNIAKDHLKAVCISATDYSTTVGVSFVESAPGQSHWRSANRISVNAQITIEHVMASSAIPLFFPPIEVEGRFYGDGCLRNTAPLSPAVHIGAEKLFVIGVRRFQNIDLNTAPNLKPSLGRVLSVLINAIFMDAVEVDLERLKIINQTVGQLKSAGVETRFRSIDTHYIHPSEGLSDLAQAREDDLPKIIRYLMRGLGSSEEAAEILSYLLFEPGYCGALVDLGYKDTMRDRPNIERFLI